MINVCITVIDSVATKKDLINIILFGSVSRFVFTKNQPGIFTKVIQLKIYSATGQSNLNAVVEQISFAACIASQKSADSAIV